MSDPLLPPPRRPAPQDLRDRIAHDLDCASGRRFRLRYVAAPLAAAALVAVTVLGVSTFSGRQTTEPATPLPVATRAAPTRNPTPTTPTAKEFPIAPKTVPAAALSLDVRTMTAQEIAQDTASCAATEASPGSVSDPTVQYARVQRLAGVDGPGSQTRVLVDQDANLTVSCQNGSAPETGGGPTDGLAGPSRSVPAVEVADFGTTQGDCVDRDASLVTTNELYAVADTVAVGRIRLNRGKSPGPWQVSTPLDGLVFFPIALTGDQAWTVPVSFDIQFLDRNGNRLTIQPYGAKQTKTTQTQTTHVETCSQLLATADSKITPPTSTADGKAECLAMAADDPGGGSSFLKRRWKAELVVSTKTEWGAVLSDGERRFGCSLYPTKEVSRLTADTTEMRASSFYFALNPIAANDGVSLWAAGRVPQDVTTISYALPGGRDVPALIDTDGYWMMKYHVDGADLARGDVADWDPVVVTVTRSSGTQNYRIPFTEKAMCNQVSHGC